MRAGFFFFFLFPFIAYSFEIRDRIAHLDYDRDARRPTLILLQGGKVLKYSLKSHESEERLKRAKREGTFVRFQTQNDRFVRSFEVLPTATRLEQGAFELSTSYVPTVLSSLDEVREIFKNLRRGSTSWSQCFNRAHICAYESKKAYDLNSMKVFLFFTTKYIRRYDYEWWFHVSPYALTEEEGGVEERVLDFRFSRSPLQVKTWTDLFMINKASCPVVGKYSEYRQNQDQEDCYLMKASMYYLQPLDLSSLEETGRERNSWNSYEVRRAYRNGFGIWSLDVI